MLRYSRILQRSGYLRPLMAFRGNSTLISSKPVELESSIALRSLSRNTGASPSDILHETEDILSSFKDQISPNMMQYHATLHKIMNNVTKSEQQTQEFENLVNLMIRYKVAHLSHCIRLLHEYIEKREYTKAFEFGQRVSAYLESNQPAAQARKIDNKYQISDMNDFDFSYFLAYLLKSRQDGTPISLEFINKTFNTKTINNTPLIKDIIRLRLPRHLMSEYFTELVPQFIMLSFNEPGNPVWKELREASTTNKKEKVTEIINNIKSKQAETDIELDATSYARIMNAYTRIGDLDAALETYKELTSKNIPLTADSWRELLRVHSKIRGESRIKRMKSILQLMQEANFFPTTECYLLLIDAYTDAGQYTEAFTYIEELEAAKGKSPAEFVSVSVPHIRGGLLLSLIKSGKLKLALKLTQNYKQKGLYEPDIRYYNAVIANHVSTNHFDQAAALVDQLLQSSFKLDGATYTIMIDGLLKLANETNSTPKQELTWIFDKMKENKISPNPVTMSAIISNCFKNPKLYELARETFQHLVANETAVNDQIYISYINGEVNAKNVAGALATYSDAIEKGFRPSVRLFNIIFRAFSLVPEIDVSIVEAFYLHTQTYRDKPNMFSFFYLLKYAELKGDPAFTQRVVDELEASSVSQLGREIPSILLSLEKAGRISIPSRLQNLIAQSGEKNQQKKAEKQRQKM